MGIAKMIFIVPILTQVCHLSTIRDKLCFALKKQKILCPCRTRHGLQNSASVDEELFKTFPLRGIAVKLRIKESKIKIFDLVFCI